MFRRVSNALLVVVACLLACLPPGSAAWAFTVYGYEDSLGMLHLSRARPSEKFQPLYESGGKAAGPPPHAALMHILREKQAVDAPQGPLTGITNLPPQAARTKGGLQVAGQAGRGGVRWSKGPYPHPRATPEIMAAIARHAEANKLDPLLVYCVIEQESCFTATAVSPKGARGIMQIMPGTGDLLGLEQPFDMEANIKAGTKYLRWMLQTFQQDATLALAAYNAGPRNVTRHGGVPPFAETQDYVARIQARHRHIMQVEAERKLKQAEEARKREQVASASSPPPKPAKKKRAKAEADSL